MKDKYSILNEVKVNIDEYEEVKFDNNDNIKQRMNKKLRNYEFERTVDIMTYFLFACHYGLL